MVVRVRARGRILEAQIDLLRILVGKTGYTIADFGFPVDKTEDGPQTIVTDLPSIKRSKETIMATSPKKGPKMHDTPPKQYD